jgi:flagellin FlaB
VVAAVFAATMLSAGLFSAQKSQESVYFGLNEVQSTLELRGDVIATANSTGSNGTVKQISFIVDNVLGGKPIDFTPPTAVGNTGIAAAGSNNKVVINYTDQNQTVKNLYWTLTKLGSTDAGNMLKQNERFEITIGDVSSTAGNGGNLVNALITRLGVNKTFTLELLSPAGAVLAIERTTPAYIDPVINLHSTAPPIHLPFKTLKGMG